MHSNIQRMNFLPNQSPNQSPIHTHSIMPNNRPTHYVRPKLDQETNERIMKRQAEVFEEEKEKNRCIYEYCPEPYSKLVFSDLFIQTNNELDEKYPDHQNGNYVCKACGCVQPEQIYEEAEERRNFFDSGLDHRRTQQYDPVYGFVPTVIQTKKRKTSSSGEPQG